MEKKIWKKIGKCSFIHFLKKLVKKLLGHEFRDHTHIEKAQKVKSM